MLAMILLRQNQSRSGFDKHSQASGCCDRAYSPLLGILELVDNVRPLRLLRLHQSLPVLLLQQHELHLVILDVVDNNLSKLRRAQSGCNQFQNIRGSISPATEHESDELLTVCRTRDRLGHGSCFEPFIFRTLDV